MPNRRSPSPSRHNRPSTSHFQPKHTESKPQEKRKKKVSSQRKKDKQRADMESRWARESSSDPDFDLGFDLEFVKKPSFTSSQKRKVKEEEKPEELPASKRLKTKGDLHTPIDVDDLSDSTVHSVSSSVVSISTQSASSPSYSDPALSAPEDDDSIGRTWPGKYYTTEIVSGFLRIDADEMKKEVKSLEERFIKVFKCPFVNGTYFDARRRFRRMAQQDIDDSVALGYTKPGLWVYLAKKYPLK